MSAWCRISIFALALIAAGCSRESPPPAAAAAPEPAPAAVPAEPAPAPLPAEITINTPGFLPEGVEYDTANKRFMVGSLAQGTVFVVGNDGTLTPFVKDPDLKSSVGIEVDEARNRLLVCNSDSAVFQGKSAGQAKLGIYNLTTGERIAMIDLAAVGPKNAKAHFANDVAVGSDGSAYVTDTMARVVYKVDPTNTATVFLPNTFEKAQQHMLNGIVASPAGYLLVAESAAGDLYKVPLDKPESFSKVKLAEAVGGADGMVLRANGNLLIVRNDKSTSLVELTSADDWATATVASKGTYEVQATTTAVADDGVYVVHPYFGDAKASPFIERVELH